MVPNTASIFMASVARRKRFEYVGSMPQDARLRDAVDKGELNTVSAGLDFSLLWRHVAKEEAATSLEKPSAPMQPLLTTAPVGNDQILCDNDIPLVVFDLKTVSVSEILHFEKPFTLHCSRAGYIDAHAFYWEVTLDSTGRKLSTSPGSPRTHWNQLLLPLTCNDQPVTGRLPGATSNVMSDGVPVTPADTLQGRFSLQSNAYYNRLQQIMVTEMRLIHVSNEIEQQNSSLSFRRFILPLLNLTASNRVLLHEVESTSNLVQEIF
jgi:hypothetical protein